MDNNNQNMEENKAHNASNTQDGRKITIVIFVILLVLGGWYLISQNNDTQTPNNISDEPSIEDLMSKASQLPEDADQGTMFDAYFPLSEAQYNAGNYADAAQSLEKITTANAEKPEVWALYAKILHALDEKDRAFQSMELAAGLDSDTPKYWLQYFDLAKELPTEQQKAIYERALEATENNSEIVSAYDTWKASQAQ